MGRVGRQKLVGRRGRGVYNCANIDGTQATFLPYLEQLPGDGAEVDNTVQHRSDLLEDYIYRVERLSPPEDEEEDEEDTSVHAEGNVGVDESELWLQERMDNSNRKVKVLDDEAEVQKEVEEEDHDEMLEEG